MALPVNSIYSIWFQGVFSDEDMIGIPTGFQAWFGNPETGSGTFYIFDNELFEIEIIKGSKTIAATVPRGIEGVISDVDEDTEQTWSGDARFFPLVRGVGSVNVKKISNRLPGEMPYAMAGMSRPMNMVERLRAWAAREHRNRVRRMMHTHELLASLSVLEGKQPAILDTTKDSEIYDFHRNSNNIITVGTEWNDSGVSFADILNDIDDGADEGVQNGKVVIDMLVIGRDILAIWQSKDDYDTYFDLRRADMGTLNPGGIEANLPGRYRRFTGPGGFEPLMFLVTPRGRRLYVFTSNQWYERPKGSVQYFMPVDEALLGSSAARCDRYFGPGDVLPPTSMDENWYRERFGFTSMTAPMPKNTPNGAIFDSRMFHFHAYEATNKKTITLVAESAPVFSTTQTDAFVTLKGLKA